MIIEPKVRGFICTTAHPEGCKKNVLSQISYTKEYAKTVPDNAPKNVLIIGASTGYGLASRIVSTYGLHANTIGIMFEKEATEKRTASAGWYNTAAFEKQATADGYYAKSINGDAFSSEVKQQTIDLIKRDLKKIDLIIYSLAAPRRKTDDGTVYSSVLKTTSKDFTNKSLDLRHNTISEATISSASEDEILHTIKVMGGEDWSDWMDALSNANVLSDHALTIAYSYIGPELTYPVYKDGTIGLAKEDLFRASKDITNRLKDKGVRAYISVNKALVTQASSAIPIVPLYMAILYKVMKEENIHEDCIMQINRLFQTKNVFTTPDTDSEGRIRMDDLELSDSIQQKVLASWDKVNSDNINDYADIVGTDEDFYHMFGFHIEDVDYKKDYSQFVEIPSLCPVNS